MINKNFLKLYSQTIIEPLPTILIERDSGLRITQISSLTKVAGLLSESFIGFNEIIFAARICNPMLTRNV